MNLASRIYEQVLAGPSEGTRRTGTECRYVIAVLHT